MNKRILFLFVLVNLLLPPGCSSRKSSEETAIVPVAATASDVSAIPLAEFLARPRAELAKFADELADRLRFQERSIQERRTQLALLPTFRLPLVVPVWREAKFSERLGFSLPPYAREDAKDSVLALHLARFGDGEAARKLAEPADAAAIDAGKYERSYPAEWTRLVGLLLHEAQMQTAAGDQEGMIRLIGFHHQLRGALDARAAKGALGAALLGRGRRVLAEAAAAWREEKRIELAAEAEKACREWGDVPAYQLPLGPGAARADVERLLGASGKGRVTPATNVKRAFDLLGLPFSDEGARSVMVFFDDGNRFTQVQLTYRDGMAEAYPRPNQLALLLDESAAGKDESQASGVRRRLYETAPFAWEVFTITHRIGVGAVVRGVGPGAQKELALARDFGIVSLDRSFEQNRVRFASEQRGDTVTAKQAKTLAQLTNLVGAVQPNEAVLQREAGHDLTARLALQFPVAESAATELHQLALPLWTTLGPGRFEDVKQGAASHLARVWRNATTEYTLRLPYAKAPVEWEARDRRTGAELAARAAEAAARDQKEHQARLAGGQAQARIPRSRERLELGMSRDQVTKLLPVGQSVQKRDIPNGVLVTLLTEPASNTVAVPREIMTRFDGHGRLAELRVRYVEGPAARAPSSKGQDPLSDLTRQGGAAQEGPAASIAIWSELPRPRPPAVQHSWQDDLTTATCTREGGITEIVLRDRAAESSFAAPLEYLPRGLIGCVLGMPREDLLRQWNVDKPTTVADGALVLTPPTLRPYDAVLVWFENGRVSRIVARHDPSASRGPAPAQLAQAVSEVWGRDLRTLGWPSHQDTTPQGVVQGLGWHDGVTRVRTFWQEQDDGAPRVYTEWKSLGRP